MHVIARLIAINTALWAHLLWWAAVRTGLRRGGPPPAQRLATTLERLGTTFVKLGQGLSQHRELLPDDYVAALGRLHDRVEPFAFEAVRAEIASSFGKPPEALFVEFDPTPLAAGSIAQVHRARLPDGRPVIVKVRRPGIRRQVSEDIRILRWFVRSVQRLLPGLRRVRPLELVEELARNLHQELDFRREADNIRRFAEVFRGSPTVYVPDVVDELYSEWVIVQEMSPGTRIDDPTLQPHGPALATHLVEAYLHQFFVAGVFHGDPHPGNLFVLADGRICLHDFGLVGYLDRRTRANLLAFMLAFVQQDGAWLLDAFVDLGMVAGALDHPAFRAGMEEVIRDYARKPLEDWSFGEAFVRVARIGQGRNARLPHHLLVLMRAIFLMESTVRRLDPQFNLMEGLFARAGAMVEAQAGADGGAGATARLKYESLVAVQQMPTELARLLHRLRTDGVELSVRHHGLDALRGELARGSSRIALALVTLGLYVAASLLMQHSLGPRWGETPVLAVLGYVAALALTWRLVRDFSDTRRDG